jgi:transposase
VKRRVISVSEREPTERKSYRIEQYLSALGHTVLRLPPYMCDLNAIELVWAKAKNYVRSAGNLTLKRLKN